MNLEEFLAAVEAAPDDPLEDREKIALGRMIFSDLFLRACKELAGQAVNATGQFTRLDLNTPEGIAKGKDLQLSVKSTFFVLETLIMQATPEKQEEKQ